MTTSISSLARLLKYIKAISFRKKFEMTNILTNSNDIPRRIYFPI